MSRFFRLSFIFMTMAIVPGTVCQESMPRSQSPFSPSDDDVMTHLIGELPVIRRDFSNFPELGSAGSLPVEVYVDELGNVTSAKIDGEDEMNSANLTKAQLQVLKSIIAEAIEKASTLRFHPFEQNGHAVPAQFEVEIPVRTLRKERGHLPFPQVHDSNSVKMVLSRSGCFGSCPIYSVEIHGDGTVLYVGTGFVAITGSHRASISSDAVSKIIEAFRAADYFSLDDKYIWGATDLPTYTTSISIDGKTKQVVDYAGEKVGMPRVVSELETTIDRLSGVERWTKGNAETVAALANENFDFHSSQASEMLANVAQMGTAEAVRDLVAAGVVVSTKPSRVGYYPPSTALGNAALRGDTDMLRALLNAGTNDPEAKTQALERAASGGKLEAMRMLIRYGANPIAPNVLIDAAASGIPAVVKELLQYKPNINGRNKDNATALLSCLHASHYKDQGVNKKQVVQILLEAGADPNLADNKGETPLIVNARDTEIADMLISHGADVNAQADDGFTALINADTPELTHLLLQHGANPFAKTKQGQTALDWARQMGHKERAALLEAAMAGEKP